MKRWQRWNAVTMSVGCLGLLGLAAPAQADDWLGLGATAGRTRLSAERSGAAFGGGVWVHALPEEADPVQRTLLASPAVGDGVVAIGSYGSRVRALREADGRLLWEVRAQGGIHGSPAIWRGRVFVADIDQQLQALRIEDGGVIWKKDVGGVVYASPAVVDGALYLAVGNPQPRLLRIDAESGAVIWQAGSEVLRQAALASVAVGGSHVVVGESGGRYHSFALADGAWQWTAETGGRVNVSSPLILGNRVYLAPGGSELRLHAVDLETGVAVPGWPLALPLPPDEPSPRLMRQVVVSSAAGTAERLVLTVRTDERFGPSEAPTRFLAREHVVAIDAQAARVLWTVATGQLDTTSANEAPSLGVVPTPTLFTGRQGEGATVLVAVASSVGKAVRVLDLADGRELWSAAVGATRGSPVFANGRLLLGSDAGTVHGLLSEVNQPPAAPAMGMTPAGGAEVLARSAAISWGAAIDGEGDDVRYDVRVDDDGEVLRDWDVEATGLAQQHLDLAGRVTAGRLYTYAVRGRDPSGAYSAWSRSETFRTAEADPTVSIDGQTAANLAAALAQAQAGSTVILGAGRFTLGETLRLPAGVTVLGAGPHLTTLRATTLAVGVLLGAGSQLRQLTVTGAQVGVAIAEPGATVRNVILRENADAGLDVRATGSATVVSVTLLRNGTGLRAAGATQLRNCLVTANDTGIAAAAPGLLTTRYDNVQGNRVSDYVGASASATDLAEVVAFDGTDSSDDSGARLRPAQPTTDRGDPSDDFTLEPAPNGGRINIGAFGNTPFAELSAEAASDGGPDSGTGTPEARADGCQCGLGGAGGGGSALGAAAAGLLLALAWSRRRR